MSDATYSGVSHVSFSVTDLDRAKQWYARVLGWQQVMAGDDGITPFAVGIAPGGFMIGLRQHPDGSADPFDPRRTGLDHVAFAVGDREELARWEQRLAELGVTYSACVDAPHGHVLSFKDPDGIALELFAPPAS